MVPTRAQVDAAMELASMRVAHWDENRWSKETFVIYTEMCLDVGVQFDADMCDEVARLIQSVRAQKENELRNPAHLR